MNETLCLLYKVLSTEQPACIYDLIPPMWKFSRHLNTFNTFFFRAEYFKNSFFTSAVSNWNKPNPDICDSSNYSIFRKSLPKLIRTVEMKPDHINDSVGIKLPTRLRLSFSHLHKNKFRHNFKDTLNSFCSCSTESGTTTHFFLCCHF